MFKNELSRRDFLKLAGLGLGTLAFRRPIEIFGRYLSERPSGREFSSGSEMEQRIPATRIPVIGYHYPGYKEAGSEIPESLVLSQMDFLKEGNFKTLTNTGLTAFLDGTTSLPAKSVVMRIDQGADHFGEFETMVGEIRKRGLQAIVFLKAKDRFTQENQDKLANWVKEGVISLGINSGMDEVKNPLIYPDVLSSTLAIIAINGRNNPRSIPLNAGYTFDELVSLNLTSITIQTVENAVGINYPELNFGNIRYLPTGPEQERHLTKPEGIIIHTDDESGTNFDNWNTSATYESCLEDKKDFNFAVGLDGIGQFLKMYKDVVTPTRGAKGFSNYISIEMCGRDYNDVFNPAANGEKKKVIGEITAKTIRLVMSLMSSYQIGLETVLGHYEATACGKTDPGQNYMDNYFRPLLRKAFQDKPRGQAVAGRK